MRSRIFAALIMLIALSGCSYFDHRCGFELRTVISKGTAKANATDSANATLTVTQRRGDDAGIEFRWEIAGIRFRDRVISMTLLDQDGNVIFNFPPPLASLPSLSAGYANETGDTDLAKVYDVLSSRSGKISIVLSSEFFAQETGYTTLTLPMQNVTANDWVRPYCP